MSSSEEDLEQRKEETKLTVLSARWSRLVSFCPVLLFISLAYLSISLDATGLLRYLAFLVSQKGGSSGPRLYLSFYTFFFAFGMLVGNDPIVLSGTGFLVYVSFISFQGDGEEIRIDRPREGEGSQERESSSRETTWTDARFSLLSFFQFTRVTGVNPRAWLFAQFSAG